MNRFFCLLVYLTIQVVFVCNIVTAEDTISESPTVAVEYSTSTPGDPIPRAVRLQIPAKQLALYISLGVFGSSVIFFGLSFICWSCNLCCTRVSSNLTYNLIKYTYKTKKQVTYDTPPPLPLLCVTFISHVVFIVFSGCDWLAF